MKKYFGLILCLVLFALLIIIVIYNKSWFWINGTLILGWGLVIIQAIYNRGDKLYWWVQKLKYFIINPDTQWDLTIRYFSKNISTELLPLVQNGLIKAAKLDRPIIKNYSLNCFEIRADELNIEVALDEDNNFLEVFFTKIPVSFRGSQRTIEQRIVPILEEIENKTSILEKTYWLTVYFGDINPYFGLIMRRIKPEQVAEMNIQIGNREEENISITKQKLTIKNKSLSALQDSARKYLTLSELPA